MKRRLLLLAELAVLAALAFPYLLTRPGPSFPLPFHEVTVRLSADGRTVCYTAQRGALAEGRLFARREAYRGAQAFTDVYLGDRCLTSGADGPSYQPALSPDGQSVAFCSEASNLGPADPNPGVDVYLLQGSHLRRLSDRDDASPAWDPALSAGGLVAFSRTRPDGLRELMLAQRTVRSVDLGSGQRPVYGAPSFSPDGLRLAVSHFSPRPTGPGASVVVLELSRQPEGWITLGQQVVSEGLEAPCFSPSLAANSCAFASAATGHYQVYVRDLDTRALTQVTTAEEDSFEPSLSADGRWLAYTSYASGSSQVYLHDRQTGSTELVSRRPDGRPGNGASYSPSLAADGSRVAFVTRAADLEPAAVPEGQIYVWERSQLTRVRP